MEERLRAEGAARSPCKGCWSTSWKQAGDLGEAFISGVRGVTRVYSREITEVISN